MKYTIYIFAFMLMVSCRRHSKKESGLNKEASITQRGDLPENPFLLHAITSAIYPKDSTTTVLYANDIAYVHATMYTAGGYPAGAVLYEVTWQQQLDEQWFGANVPRIIKKIERVEVISANAPHYTLFLGDIPLKVEHSTDDTERTTFILGQKMAVSP